MDLINPFDESNAAPLPDTIAPTAPGHYPNEFMNEMSTRSTRKIHKMPPNTTTGNANAYAINELSDNESIYGGYVGNSRNDSSVGMKQRFEQSFQQPQQQNQWGHVNQQQAMMHANQNITGNMNHEMNNVLVVSNTPTNPHGQSVGTAFMGPQTPARQEPQFGQSLQQPSQSWDQQSCQSWDQQSCQSWDQQSCQSWNQQPSAPSTPLTSRHLQPSESWREPSTPVNQQSCQSWDQQSCQSWNQQPSAPSTPLTSRHLQPSESWREPSTPVNPVPANGHGGGVHYPLEVTQSMSHDIRGDRFNIDQSLTFPLANASAAANSANHAPNNANDDDFFGIFSANTPAKHVEETTPVRKAEALSSGSGIYRANSQPSRAPATKPVEATTGTLVQKAETCYSGDGRELPPGGRFLQAKMHSTTIGVIFSAARGLNNSLFQQAGENFIKALGNLPVVAYTMENRAARQSGIELGYVLLKVNGVNVKDCKHARELIKKSTRPLMLYFYVPNVTVVLSEGMYMVKYDSRKIKPPKHSLSWKPKYVVVEGIVGKNRMIYMYRSKAQYDTAIMEKLAGRKVSVKVKEFGLYRGSRILQDETNPEKLVKYLDEDRSWKYFVLLRRDRLPFIKIASPEPDGLKPVYDKIRRVLSAANEDPGKNYRRE